MRMEILFGDEPEGLTKDGLNRPGGIRPLTVKEAWLRTDGCPRKGSPPLFYFRGDLPAPWANHPAEGTRAPRVLIP